MAETTIQVTNTAQLGPRQITPDGRYEVSIGRDYVNERVSGNTSARDIPVYRTEIATGAVTTYYATVFNDAGVFADLEVLNNGKVLLTEGGRNGVGATGLPFYVLDLASRMFTPSQVTFGANKLIASSVDGRLQVIAGGIDQKIAALDAAGNVLAVRDATPELGPASLNPISAEAISAANNQIVLGTSKGLYLYDTSLNFQRDLLPQLTQAMGVGTVRDIAFNADGSKLYAVNREAQAVFEFSTASWPLLRGFALGQAQSEIGDQHGQLVSPDGRYLYIRNGFGTETIRVDLTTDNQISGTAGADGLTGTPYPDLIYGGSGDDRFESSAASDTLFGGDGNDTYTVSGVADVIVERPNGGSDTVITSVPLTMPGNVETLQLAPGAIATITANPAGGTLIGNEFGTLLVGGLGVDTFVGGFGDDILQGGAGDVAAFRDRLANASFEIVKRGGGLPRYELFVVSADGRDSLGTIASETDGKLSPVGISSLRFNDVTVSTLDLLGAADRIPGISDFDGNGHSDLLWRHTDGTFSTWQVSGQPAGNQFQLNSTFVTGVTPDWRIAETFDFNGDGRSDILWRNAGTGQFSVWSGEANGWGPNRYFDSSVASDWKIAGVGDLNGDGRDDIVWRQDGGAFSIWQSTGSGFAVNTTFDTSVSPTWQIVGLADFNKDGRDDLMWRNQASGEFSVWQSTFSGFTPNTTFDSSVDTTWHVDALADFNGDGRDDILWRHDGDGAFTIWQANGAGFTPNTYINTTVASVWQVAQAGDFNDDGRADILWRNTADGTFSTWQSNGNGFDANVVFQSGVGTDWQIQGHDFRFG